MQVFVSNSPEETEVIAARMARSLKPGSRVVLTGDLGGGKTSFTRGIVSVLAPESVAMVSSPTYAIMNIYEGRIPVYHFDVYRLSGIDDADELGFGDYFNGNGVSVIEWGEKLGEEFLDGALRITFEYLDEYIRKITVED